MVGNIAVVESCKEEVHDGGVLILFGLPKKEAVVVEGKNFARIIFSNEEIRVSHKGKRLTLRGITGRSQQTWKEMILALQRSPALRKRLQMPLHMAGNLHALEKVINNARDGPLRAMKVGMTAFPVLGRASRSKR